MNAVACAQLTFEMLLYKQKYHIHPTRFDQVISVLLKFLYLIRQLMSHFYFRCALVKWPCVTSAICPVHWKPWRWTILLGEETKFGICFIWIKNCQFACQFQLLKILASCAVTKGSGCAVTRGPSYEHGFTLTHWPLGNLNELFDM